MQKTMGCPMDLIQHQARAAGKKDRVVASSKLLTKQPRLWMQLQLVPLLVAPECVADVAPR